MRKALPHYVHVGCCKAKSGKQKELMVWGFVDTSTIDTVILRDDAYSIDLVDDKKYKGLHNHIGLTHESELLDQCNVKFKGKVYGILLPKIKRCHEQLVLPSNIRMGFANVPISQLPSVEYDPKQTKLSFSAGSSAGVASETAFQHKDSWVKELKTIVVCFQQT